MLKTTALLTLVAASSATSLRGVDTMDATSYGLDDPTFGHEDIVDTGFGTDASKTDKTAQPIDYGLPTDDVNMNTMVNDHTKAMFDKDQAHLATVAAKDEEFARKESEHEAAKAELQKELQTKHDAHMDAVEEFASKESEHEAAKAELQKELQAKHEAHMDAVEDNHEAMFDKDQAHLATVAAKDEEFARKESEHEAAKAELQKELQTKHDAHMDAVEDKHKAEEVFEEKERKHLRDLKRVEEKAASDVIKAEEESKKQHDEALVMKTRKFEDDKRVADEEHARLVIDFEKKEDELKKSLDDKDDEHKAVKEAQEALIAGLEKDFDDFAEIAEAEKKAEINEAKKTFTDQLDSMKINVVPAIQKQREVLDTLTHETEQIDNLKELLSEN